MSEVIDAEPAAEAPSDFDPQGITRPDSILLRYYIFVSALTLPAFPFVFLPLYFKYRTLKYRFDDSGISMSWGILFRREIHLTYRRIQDIHLTRNLIQRWMGLATVAIQTASGSAGPEMSIEGILEAEALRDYLYGRMRGARGLDEEDDESAAGVDSRDEALALLRDIRDALQSVAAAGAPESGPPSAPHPSTEAHPPSAFPPTGSGDDLEDSGSIPPG